MIKIKIKKSPTADTRTCDHRKVSKEQLRHSSKSHIRDISKAGCHFLNCIAERFLDHDHDKLEDIDGFHRDFKSGFKPGQTPGTTTT